MRNARLLQLTIAFSTFLLFLPSTASAQFDGEVGLKYSEHAEGLGIFFGGWYPVMDIIDLGGEFTFFFPQSDEYGDWTMWAIDLNGRYAIPLESAIRLFAVGGLNFNHWTYPDLDEKVVGWDTADTETGLNLGAMAEFGGEDFGFFAALKFIIGGAEGLNLGGGVRKRF